MDDKYLADPVKNLAACINKCVAFFEAKREGTSLLCSIWKVDGFFCFLITEKKAEKAAAATTDGKDEHPPPVSRCNKVVSWVDGSIATKQDPVGDDHDIISCAHILCNMKSQESSNIQELQEAQQQSMSLQSLLC